MRRHSENVVVVTTSSSGHFHWLWFRQSSESIIGKHSCTAHSRQTWNEQKVFDEYMSFVACFSSNFAVQLCNWALSIAAKHLFCNGFMCNNNQRALDVSHRKPNAGNWLYAKFTPFIFCASNKIDFCFYFRSLFKNSTPFYSRFGQNVQLEEKRRI